MSNPAEAAAPCPAPIRLSAADEPPTERRAAVRFPCQPGTFASVHRCGARRQGLALGRSATALVRDVSQRGLGLLLDFPAGLGSVLEVDVYGLDSRRTLLVRVVHIVCRRGSWLHGCEVANPLTGAEMARVLPHE